MNRDNNNENSIININQKFSEVRINRCNICTYNVCKGFVKKSTFIWEIFKTNNVTIALLTDLGITKEELQQHFIEKSKGKYQSKGYVIPGYTIYVNEWKEETRIAIALSNLTMEVNKGMHITYGNTCSKIDGRMISARTKLENGEEVVFISIYAPNEGREHEEFMEAVTKRIYKHKYKSRKIILGGDFNATRKEEYRGVDTYEGHNAWPWDIESVLGDSTVATGAVGAQATWKQIGERVVYAELDYIMVDLDLIKECKVSKRIIESEAISDHTAIITYTNIPIIKPTETPYSFNRIIDIEKINVETKSAIQEDACIVSNTYQKIVEEIKQEPANCTSATEFYNIVSKLALAQRFFIRFAPA